MTLLRFLPQRFVGFCGAAAIACAGFHSGAQAQSPALQPMACLQLLETLSAEGRVTLQGVSFDFNRATLRPDSLPALIAARDAILTLGGEWRLEGHTDTVGSRDYNLRLSEARAQAVRAWLISAGVPGAQVLAEGFSFDRPIADNTSDAGRARNRRVELVGTVMPDALGFGGPDGVDPCPATLTPGTLAAEISAPPIPDWSGATGQEWLPFSLLMATGHGGTAGWSGDRLEMPPGARPEACQALCSANSDCAAFSFEPAGSDFVENARCALIGYGSEMDLTRSNTYLDGGTFYVSGLKADARLLTTQSAALAQEIIADLAEIARLRESVHLSAPDMHVPETWMSVALEGAVPGSDYPSYVEIALPEDYAFYWYNSKAAIFVRDMPDGRSGQIWVPEPGEYVLRYVINHPTAGLHTITERSFVVRADAPMPAGPAASLSFPMVVTPGESIPVTYNGPHYSGDWVDIITQGNDADMSGGWSWAYATGAPVALTAPDADGDYVLRYVAEHPTLGRVVLAQEALAVRTSIAPPTDLGALFNRCDGAPLTTCDLVFPDQDVALSLLSGYGITEPLHYQTAGGIRAEHPSFEIVRLSDGQVPLMVNPRQAQTVYCQATLTGDEVCLTPSFNESEGMLAGVIISSLARPSAPLVADAMGGEDEGSHSVGGLQGVWFFALDTPGQVGDQDYFVIAELMQDAGQLAVTGTFTTAPNLGPLPGLSGEISGVVAGDTLNLTMVGPQAESGLVFTGSEFGGDAYRGMVFLVHSPLTPPTGAILRKVAGPGEDWPGPPWMTGAAEGMDAALQLGAAELLRALDGLEGEEREMAALLGQMLGAMGGATEGPGAKGAQPSPEMTALDGTPLGELTAQEALQLLAPHLED